MARFPEATFVLGRVAGSHAQSQLTLKGQTRPVLVPVTVAPLGPGSLLLQGTLRSNRPQFSINYNSSGFFQNLGSYAIRKEFQLAFQLKAGRRQGVARAFSARAKRLVGCYHSRTKSPRYMP